MGSSIVLLMRTLLLVDNEGYTQLENKNAAVTDEICFLCSPCRDV
jgi:hypothetical protein